MEKIKVGSKGGTMKTTSATLEPKPYHHGDLRRALMDSADAILERDGPNALSLRAVAREAGVSPAAPYHHFKDKDELLSAIAREGKCHSRSGRDCCQPAEILSNNDRGDQSHD